MLQPAQTAGRRFFQPIAEGRLAAVATILSLLILQLAHPLLQLADQRRLLRDDNCQPVDER